MKYCGEQGCKNLVSYGRYCENHKRRYKKKVVYSRNKTFYNTQAWKDLKEYCYQRDGGCCQRCNKFVFGKRAHHHHKIPIRDDPKLKLDTDNIITLCPQCHMIIENEDKVKKHSNFNWNL